MSNKEFIFNIDDEVVVKGITETLFLVIGRGQYKGLKENKYLIQEIGVEFDYDFGKGAWYEEKQMIKFEE